MSDELLTELIQQLLEERQQKGETVPERTADTIGNELEANAQRIKPLQKMPIQNKAKLGKLYQEQDALFAELNGLQASQRQAAKSANAPQIAQLESEISAISTEMQALQKFPSRNRDRLRELGAQLESKSRQVEALK